MKNGIPANVTFENFATEGLLRFLKKVFGGKKQPIDASNSALVEELLRRINSASGELEKDFEPEPFVVPESKSMAVKGDLQTVVNALVQMNDWLNSAGNINEAKRYCTELKKGIATLEATYKENSSKLDEDDLQDLIIQRGKQFGKTVKHPRLSNLGGSAVEWDPSLLSKPGSPVTPTAKEVFSAIRSIYNNYTPLPVLEKKWKGGDFAGTDWDHNFWMSDVGDSEVGDIFYHQADPAKYCGAPRQVLYAYQETLEAVLDYCVKCFDLKDA